MAVSVDKIEFQITARDQATRVFKELQGAVGSLKSSFIAMSSAVAGAAVFTKFLSDAISVRSALDDLSDTTGDNVKTLDGLRRIANVAGVDMDRLGGALTKLAKNMNSADDDGKAAGEAIKAIGLDIETLRAKKPGEAMFEIAMALSKFEDGAAKVAVAMALMGKEGAKMLPLLKDMAEEGRLNGRITGEQAAAAEELEKSYRRLKQSFADGKDALATQMIPSLTALINEMTEGIRITGSLTNALITLGTINPFRSVRGNIESLQADIASRNAQRAAMVGKTFGDGSQRYTGAIADIDAANRADLQRLEFLKFQQRQQALAGSSGDSPGERARMGALRAQLNFTIPDKEKKGPRENAFETLKRQMEEQLAKVGELTEYEKLLGLLQTERYAKITPAQRDELIQLAAKLELNKEDARLQKEIEQIMARAAEESARNALREAERLNQLRDKYADLADPLEKYRKELKEIRELQEIGYLTAEQARLATLTVVERMYGEMKTAKKEIDKGADLWKDFGVAASSALERVVFEGGKARDVIRALLLDMAKIYFRQQVANPLVNGALSLFGFGGSTDKGGISGGEGKSLLGFATGGDFTVGGSGGTDSQLVAFRATPGEQVSIKTPGQQGGGSTFIIDARGADRTGLARLENMIKRLDGSIEYRAVAATADARQRGGAYSGAMGR